jgi:acetylornithine deacetylase/succinyl-diaminopimelate desuccinylase-like protein
VNRGIENTKGPLCQFFNALKAIKAVTGTYPCNFKFMLEGEEELGSLHLPDFVRENKSRLGADAAYFAFYAQEPDGKVTMSLGVKGIVFLELTARGGAWGGPMTRMVHSSNAVWFDSPTWRLVHALATMLAPDQKTLTIDGIYDDIVPPSAEDEQLLAELAQTFDEANELQQGDVLKFKYDLHGADLMRKYLFEPSLNIDGIISGHTEAGTKTVLPHEARAKIDIRLIPNMRPARVIELVRAHLDRRGFTEIEVSAHDAYGWAKARVSDPPVQAMLRALRGFGFPMEIWPHTAGSAPFYLFRDELQMPFVEGGLGHGGRAHSPNEYATIEGMKLFEKSVAAFLYEFVRA